MVLEPRLTLSKVQEIKGTGSGFTSSLLTGTVGQTVLYQITAKNTGNVPLTLSEFTDIYCDEHTISGGLPWADAGAGRQRHLQLQRQAHRNPRKLERYPERGVGRGHGVGRRIEPETGQQRGRSQGQGPASAGPQTTTTPGSGNPAPAAARRGTLGGSTSTGSTGSTGDPKSGTLGAKSSKKRHHKVTVAHKTPKFTG